MKNAENKLADKLFDVVKKLIDRSLWRVNEHGVYFNALIGMVSRWHWRTKKEFLLDEPGQELMSFAKACMHNNIVSILDASLRDAVLIMASSSSLEEIKLKFELAGLTAA